MDDTSECQRARMVDVAFALEACGPAVLPRDHRESLARALETALPWLAASPDGRPAAGVHPLKLAGGSPALLARRTRLVLRVPRERAGEAVALAGRVLTIDGLRLTVGAAQVRELLPWGTLYAHCVSVPGEQAEVDFLRALDTPGRAICGRAQLLEGGRVRGYSLMLDGLSAAQALDLMDRGVGAHRRLGCGLFVPHRCAAAVGAPP